MGEFKMPSLGADMTAGTLLEWRVSPGEHVKRGDIVAVVDTSKAEIEVEIFEDGVIGELLVAEGRRVPVGTPLATVLPEGEVAAPATPPAPPAPAAPPTPPPAPPPPHVRASPVARRMAQELGVDLSTLAGSGPGGAIVQADVERAAAAGAKARPEPAAQASAQRQAAMRLAIGALMARSKREVPHYYLQRHVDFSVAASWLQERNAQRPVDKRLLPAALLLAASAQAAREMPQMNGFWVDQAFRQAEAVHLGVAVSLRGGGLVAPALRNADQLSLDQLMAALRDLVSRARAGVLRSSEMSDPTITVTNLGEQGADLVHGVIYAPQVALVGFGAVRERPWAQDGMLGVRQTVLITLAADHRASDGHAGSRFLSAIGRRLQRPEEM